MLEILQLKDQILNFTYYFFYGILHWRIHQLYNIF